MVNVKKENSRSNLNIAVLVKQVPNTQKIKIDPTTGSMIRKGVPSIINPEDLLGLELALSIKDKYKSKITAITMGPPQSIDVLTEAIGMGVDEGVLLTDKNFAGADTLATSYTLGKSLKKISKNENLNLVITGRQAIDGDTAQIGPQVAEYLNWPQLTYVTKLEIDDTMMIYAWRDLIDNIEKVKCPIPAVITVSSTAELNPRWPMIDKLIQACNASQNFIKIWNAADIEAPISKIGLKGSQTQVIETFSPKSKRKTTWTKGSIEEISSQFIEFIQQKKII